MTCPFCGSEIKDGDKYCGRCGATVSTMADSAAQPAAEKQREKYNTDGIIGFGLITVFVVLVAVNVCVFVTTYGGMYLGGNPLLYLVSMIFPVICLAYSIGGMRRRREADRGNRLTVVGLVINAAIIAVLLITFIITLCLFLP